jgi:hypothetical protein
LAVKNRETNQELYWFLISLAVRVNVDAFRMNILNWGTCGMMTDVVASDAVKVTENHSAFVLCHSF